MEVAAFEDIYCLPLLIPYPMFDSRYDAILKNVWDDKKVLITSDLHLQGDFPPRTYFGLSYTIFISSFDLIPIMIFIWPSSDWPLDHGPNAYSFNSTF